MQWSFSRDYPKWVVYWWLAKTAEVVLSEHWLSFWRLLGYCLVRFVRRYYPHDLIKLNCLLFGYLSVSQHLLSFVLVMIALEMAMHCVVLLLAYLSQFVMFHYPAAKLEELVFSAVLFVLLLVAPCFAGQRSWNLLMSYLLSN